MIINRTNKRNFRNYKHYKSSSPVIEYIMFPLFIIFLFSRFLKLINKNISLIIIICIIFTSAKFLYNCIVQYIEYLKCGKIKISKTQLNLLLRSLSPRQFEVFCAELFKELGYDSILMDDGPDGGKDVILNNEIYVECKRYNSSTIEDEICKKLLGAVEADGMEKGILFTNGKLNRRAKEIFFKTKRLELWNLDKIFVKLNSLEIEGFSNVIDIAIKYKEYNEDEKLSLQTEI